MIDLGLIIARLLHYMATTTLAGVSFFPLYGYAGTEPAILAQWRKHVLLAAAVIALLSGLIWFAFTVANMSGDLADLAHAETMLSVLRDTSFGTVWAARMLLVVAIIVVTAKHVSSPARGGQDLITSLLAAGLLASLAGAGTRKSKRVWPAPFT